MNWFNWILLIIALWNLWNRWPMHPQLPNIAPADVLEAARAITSLCLKWGQVADVIMSWHVPAVFLVGGMAGAFLMGAWGNRKQS